MVTPWSTKCEVVEENRSFRGCGQRGSRGSRRRQHMGQREVGEKTLPRGPGSLCGGQIVEGLNIRKVRGIWTVSSRPQVAQEGL